MTAHDGGPLPRREILQAVLLAALCSLLFLRAGVLPTRAVVPFVPERFEPLQSQALAEGRVGPIELALGNVTMGDKYNQSLAWDRILQDRLRAGEIPAWSRDIAGGVPFVPQQAQVYQPWNLLLLLPIESAGVYGVWFFLHQVLFGLGAWWFVRRLGVSHAAALCALVVAVLGLWTQARVHHNVILSAALPVFPLLTLVLGAFRQGASAGRIAGVGLLLGVSWLGGFPPVALQVTGLTALWSLACAAHFRRARPLIGLAAGAAIGALIGAAQILPTLVAAGASSRTSWSAAEFGANGLSWQHLRSFVWPDLLHWPDLSITGGAFRPSWTALELLEPSKARDFNYPETAFAIGLPGLLLALLALRRGRTAWFFAVIALLAFGLATASTPFLELSGLVPGARAGDLRRFLFLVAVAGTVLVGLGAERLASPASRRAALALAVVAVAICTPLFVGQLDSLSNLDAFRREWAARLSDAYGAPVTADLVLAEMDRFPLEAPANRSMLLWTSARSLTIAVACAVALFLRSGRGRVAAWSTLLGLELLLAGAGTIVPVPVARVAERPEVLAPVHDAAAPNGVRPRLIRLAPPAQAREFLPPNLGAYWGIEDLGAYEPLPARRMEELFLAIEPDAAPPDPKPSVALHGAGVIGFFRPESLAHPMLDVLGARFVLAARDLAGPSLADRTPDAVPPPYRLYERRSVLPRATFCDTAEIVTDSATRLALLGDAARDPRGRVILEEPTATPTDGDGVADAAVTIVEHADEQVVVQVTAREAGYLRLADPWDPGWTATVDGAPTPVLVADHYLRAVFVEPGEHLVRFEYDGAVVLWPRVLAAIGALAVLALAILAAMRHRHTTAATLARREESS